MKVRHTISAALLVTMTGCATIDRGAVSDFRPSGPTTFEYRAQAGALDYPADSPAAEQVRMDWLRTWLTDNEMCPAGYQIIERHEVKIGFGARIHYTGRCT